MFSIPWFTVTDSREYLQIYVRTMETFDTNILHQVKKRWGYHDTCR